MKKLTIIISKIMLVILTFTNVQSASAQQTAKQKIIGKELSAITAGVIQNLNDFNVKAVLKRYAKEVKSVNADGSINDYPLYPPVWSRCLNILNQ